MSIDLTIRYCRLKRNEEDEDEGRRGERRFRWPNGTSCPLISICNVSAAFIGTCRWDQSFMDGWHPKDEASPGSDSPQATRGSSYATDGAVKWIANPSCQHDYLHHLFYYQKHIFRHDKQGSYSTATLLAKPGTIYTTHHTNTTTFNVYILSSTWSLFSLTSTVLMSGHSPHMKAGNGYTTLMWNQPYSLSLGIPNLRQTTLLTTTALLNVSRNINITVSITIYQ